MKNAKIKNKMNDVTVESADDDNVDPYYNGMEGLVEDLVFKIGESAYHNHVENTRVSRIGIDTGVDEDKNVGVSEAGGDIVSGNGGVGNTACEDETQPGVNKDENHGDAVSDRLVVGDNGKLATYLLEQEKEILEDDSSASSSYIGDGDIDRYEDSISSSEEVGDDVQDDRWGDDGWGRRRVTLREAYEGSASTYCNSPQQLGRSTITNVRGILDDDGDASFEFCQPMGSSKPFGYYELTDTSNRFGAIGVPVLADHAYDRPGLFLEITQGPCGMNSSLTMNHPYELGVLNEMGNEPLLTILREKRMVVGAQIGKALTNQIGKQDLVDWNENAYGRNLLRNNGLNGHLVYVLESELHDVDKLLAGFSYCEELKLLSRKHLKEESEAFLMYKSSLIHPRQPSPIFQEGIDNHTIEVAFRAYDELEDDNGNTMVVPTGQCCTLIEVDDVNDDRRWRLVEIENDNVGGEIRPVILSDHSTSGYSITRKDGKLYRDPDFPVSEIQWVAIRMDDNLRACIQEFVTRTTLVDFLTSKQLDGPYQITSIFRDDTNGGLVANLLSPDFEYRGDDLVSVRTRTFVPLQLLVPMDPRKVYMSYLWYFDENDFLYQY